MSHAIELGSRPLHANRIDTTSIPHLNAEERLDAWLAGDHIDILRTIAVATSGQTPENIDHSFDPGGSFGVPMKYDSEGMRRGISFAAYREKVLPVSSALFHDIIQSDLNTKEKLDKIGLIEATAFYQAQLLPDGNSRMARALRNYVLHGVEGVANGYNGIGDMCPPDSLENDFVRNAAWQHSEGRFDKEQVVEGKYRVSSGLDLRLKEARKGINKMIGPRLSTENGEEMKKAMHSRMVTVGRELQETLGDKELSAEVATILCQKVGHATLAILQSHFRLWPDKDEITTLSDIDTEKAGKLVEINNNILSSRIIQIIAGIARGGKYYKYNEFTSPQIRVQRWLPRIQTREEFIAARMDDATVPPDQLLSDI